MNKITYEKIQELMKDMLSIKSSTCGCEGFSEEVDYWVITLAGILNVDVPKQLNIRVNNKH